MVSLTGVKPKEVRVLLREWQSRGAILTMTTSNHIRVQFPSGGCIHTSLTSSDRRVVKKIRSDARKYADWE